LQVLQQPDQDCKQRKGQAQGIVLLTATEAGDSTPSVMCVCNAQRPETQVAITLDVQGKCHVCVSSNEGANEEGDGAV